MADYMHLYCQQVTKLIPKQAKKIMKSARESAKIAWIKSHKKKSLPNVIETVKYEREKFLT